jgi:hypothetical protein
LGEIEKGHEKSGARDSHKVSCEESHGRKDTGKAREKAHYERRRPRKDCGRANGTLGKNKKGQERNFRKVGEEIFTSCASCFRKKGHHVEDSPSCHRSVYGYSNDYFFLKSG